MSGASSVYAGPANHKRFRKVSFSEQHTLPVSSGDADSDHNGLLVLVSSTRLYLQAPASTSITVGGLDLRLGMSQIEVLKLLGTIYDLRPVEGAPGSWVVLRRGVTPLEVVGSIGFTAGQMSYASRQWAVSSSQNADSFAMGVIDALRGLAHSPSGCTLTAQTIQLAGPAEQVTVTCAGRSVEITGSRDARVAASATESIRAPR